MPASRITTAVDRLANLFRGEPDARLTSDEIGTLTGLDSSEARIVVDALKDAGFLEERADGSVGHRTEVRSRR